MASPLPYFFFRPKVSDIVLVKMQEKAMVKRISKIQGQTIEVVGDNLEQSTDSRDFGPIPRTAILAKIFYP